ncbi:LacI family DNA-binding transcriptional regulator [Treponema sp.]|uniref:LacI family DNA-binding transcriptional regulator n=1 Tax=Treponema sp. TaxID=166 RepID=UPI00388DE78D
MPENYTIYDLARDCGVSVATISRVINGSDAVSSKTREKVQQTMKAHNYTPNVFARGMNKMSTKIIAVFISDIANPFFADIVKGIEETCRRYEYRIILSITNNDMAQEKKELELMMQKQVDGFIICGSRPVADTNAEYLREISNKHPVIMVNSRIDGGEKLYSVLVDEKTASENALETILSKGHYKRLYVFGDTVWQTTKDKIEAAEKVCKKLSVPFDSDSLFQCPHTLEAGYEGAVRFLKQKPVTPCLVFCVSDQIAVGVLKTLGKFGMKTGEDFGVLGFSNISLCQLVTPSLTTVNQYMKNLGEQAANLFISSQNGIILDEKVFYSDYELIERESTV